MLIVRPPYASYWSRRSDVFKGQPDIDNFNCIIWVKPRWTLRHNTGEWALGDGRSRVGKSSKLRKLPTSLIGVVYDVE